MAEPPRVSRRLAGSGGNTSPNPEATIVLGAGPSSPACCARAARWYDKNSSAAAPDHGGADASTDAPPALDEGVDGGLDAGENAALDASGEDATADTGADADTCPPSGCTGACLSSNTHNVATLFDGCLVWECCVPDDAGPDTSAE
jgi:hypothetical protein